MLSELLSYLICGIFFLVKMLAGYVIPIALSSQAAMNKDKEKMNRWLIHFLFFAVAHYFVFPTLTCVGLNWLLGPIISVAILLMPTLGLHEVVISKATGAYEGLIIPKIDVAREVVKNGLIALNLY